MFKLIGWVIKASLFAVVILVASHFITWNGRTVSDQVGSTMSSAERSPSLRTVKKKSARMIEDARSAAENALRSEHKAEKKDAIPHEDKEELRALIDTACNRQASRREPVNLGTGRLVSISSGQQVRAR